MVDDEAGTRSALHTVLRLAGHNVYFATDGDEALDIFDHAHPLFDLIITDHAMARVSGIDFVRSLRERGFAGDIVVLTAYAGTIDEQQYRKLEVAGIMEKPFDIAELRHWIDCIHESGDDKPAPPGPIHFYWLRHD